MTATVLAPGLQTTIQGRCRTGLRHMGVPACGPADPLSMALANRLVTNAAGDAALETTLTGVSLRFHATTHVAVAGALADCVLNDSPVAMHRTIAVQPGDVLVVGAAKSGMRSYVAVAGGFVASEVLGSVSTYLPGKFGGMLGRALQQGDKLEAAAGQDEVAILATPDEFKIVMPDSWTLRAARSCETSTAGDADAIFSSGFTVSRRSDRMGIRLDGVRLRTGGSGSMASVPVFPGTIQCPQDGSPYILCVDAGTTGGYPRVAKICRVDLHALGQLRPGNRVALLEREVADAARELEEKHVFWRRWLADAAEII